jgi:hypothetical protein
MPEAGSLVNRPVSRETTDTTAKSGMFHVKQISDKMEPRNK